MSMTFKNIKKLKQSITSFLFDLLRDVRQVIWVKHNKAFKEWEKSNNITSKMKTAHHKKRSRTNTQLNLTSGSRHTRTSHQPTTYNNLPDPTPLLVDANAWIR